MSYPPPPHPNAAPPPHSSSLSEVFKRPHTLLRRKKSASAKNRPSSASIWKSSSLVDLRSRSSTPVSQVDPWGSQAELNRSSWSSDLNSTTASVKSHNLRSTGSWRNLLLDPDTKVQPEQNISTLSRNRGHRLSLRPVRPPIVPLPVSVPGVPGQNNKKQENNQHIYYVNRNQPVMARKNSESRPFQTFQGIQSLDMPLSPGHDSLGRNSTTSLMTTTESTSSLGYGGRNSNSIDETSTTSSTFGTRGPPPPPPQRTSTSSVFQRQSHYSSNSSMASSQSRGDDVICPVNVKGLMQSGLPDEEILNAWLTDLGYECYFSLFVSAGYDLPTISRMTPEDLTAIGIQKPNHRKRIKSEISKLEIHDGLPDYIPTSLEEWLYLIRLPEYGPPLSSQGYQTVDDVIQISIEDLEDVGIYKLGHQKRFLLAVKKIKALQSGRMRPNSVMMTNHYGAMRKSVEKQPDMSAMYRPEVIQIVNPSQKGNLPSPQKTSNDAFYHSAGYKLNFSPQKSPNVLASIPEPMKPFSHLTSPNKTSTFAYRNHISESHRNHPTELPLRSLDDSQLSMNKTLNTFSSMTNVASGGTLPRPKGMVKPLPVAKIPATLRDQNDFDVYQDDLESKECAKPAAVKQLYRTSPREAPASSRSAGDVLNDIGSMLADLTDELDAMLHSEHRTPDKA